MAQLDHLHGLLSGVCRFGGDSRQFQHKLCMLQGHRVIIDYKHAQFVQVDVDVSVVLLVLFRRILQGDGNGKGGALALFAFYLDVAVHQFYDTLGNGKAQARTAILAGTACVFLGKGLEQLGQKVLAHADTRVLDGKPEGGFAVERGCLLDAEIDAPALVGELDGVPEDVDEHLPELHVVAYEVFVDVSDKVAVVLDSLFLTLHAEHGVYLFHELGEGEFLVLQGELARFDAGHVQNFVDEVQQVFGGASDFLQVVLDLVRKSRFMEGETVQPDDGVHGSANLVAHVGEEYGLCPVGFFCHLQGLGQGLPLDTVLGFLDFVLERNPCGAPDMQDDKDEHGDEHKGRYRRKELAPDDNSRRDAANLVADDAFPDEVGEHPVCIVDRHVVQGLANVIVGE